MFVMYAITYHLIRKWYPFIRISYDDTFIVTGDLFIVSQLIHVGVFLRATLWQDKKNAREKMRREAKNERKKKKKRRRRFEPKKIIQIQNK